MTSPLSTAGPLTGSGRLVLIRHGRTAWNASARFQGQCDVPLDEVGRAEAEALASRLAALPLAPAAIVSSDLARARDTAAALGLALGVTPSADERLREIHLGAWQGLDAAAASERFPAEYDEWRSGNDVRRGGGETYAEVADRAASCALEVAGAHPQQVVVLVTHGGTARSLIGRLAGFPLESWSALGPLANCRLSVLAAAGERGWRLMAHNGLDLGR